MITQPCTDVTRTSLVFVQFEFRTYQIREDSSPVQPMLVISRPITVDVMVQVDTENLSALGMLINMTVFAKTCVVRTSQFSASEIHNKIDELKTC